MNYAYLQHWAHCTPHAPAAITPGHALSFAQVLAHVDAGVEILRRAGVCPGHRVAMNDRLTGLYRMVMYFALDKIGAVSALKGTELGWFDFTVSAEASAGERQVVYNHSTLTAALAGPMRTRGEPPYAWNPEDACRIYFSSGSSGPEKVMQRSYGSYRDNLDNFHLAHPLGPGDVVLPIMGIATPGILIGCSAWMRGAAIAFLPMRSPQLLNTALSLGVTAIAAAPAAIQWAAREWTANEPFPRLTIYFYGAQADGRLLGWVRDHLTPHVMMNYGTTEAGLGLMTPLGEPIAERTHGLPMPSVQIDIVGDDGHTPVPDGSVGRLRQRCRYAATDGYLDAEGRCTPFPADGLVSQDLGIRDAHGHVHMIGRGDDVVNLGGQKIPFSVIERRLGSTGLLLEQAAFRMEEDGPNDRKIWIAVVLKSPGVEAELVQAIRGKWPTMDCSLLRIADQLPRLPSEKVDVQALKSIARDMIRQRPTH